jgi:TrmH family RNA methyltransferase
MPLFSHSPSLSSRQNPLCKLVRSLHNTKGRRESGQFLIEGKNGVEAALAAKWKVHRVLCAPDDIPLWQHGTAPELIQAATPEILEYLSEAQSNPRVLALASLPDFASTLPANLTLVLDGIGDPGNIGTLIRSADAAGAGGVLCAANSADPFSPKAVRSSAGSLFHVPILKIGENAPEKIARALQQEKIPVIIADASGEVSCFEYSWPQRCALILGHETRGVSRVFQEAVTAKIKIPIYGKAESLNVANAGSILLYAWREKLVIPN